MIGVLILSRHWCRRLPMRVAVVRTARAWRARAARRMAASGLPHRCIRLACGMTPRRLTALLAGDNLWSAAERALMRSAA